MSRIVPPPTRSSLVDKLGNLSQNWIDWFRGIKSAAETSLDIEVLQAFAQINQAPAEPDAFSIPSPSVDGSVFQLLEDASKLSESSPADRSVDPEDVAKMQLFAPTPREWSEVELIEDTWAHLGNYPAGQHRFALFYATDRTVYYRSTGTDWVYRTGEYPIVQAAIAALVATLGANDAGLILAVTDFKHSLKWSGGALNFKPGDDGSNYFIDAPSAPLGKLVQLCDGTITTYLKADGTLGSYTTKNLTGHFRKSVTSGADTTVAAVAPAFTGSGGTTDSDNDAGSRAAAGAGGDPLVALNPHQHTFTLSGTVDGTGEPPAYTVLTYFRR
jgi:hypothetical protein